MMLPTQEPPTPNTPEATRMDLMIDLRPDPAATQSQVLLLTKTLATYRAASNTKAGSTYCRHLPLLCRRILLRPDADSGPVTHNRAQEKEASRDSLLPRVHESKPRAHH